MNTGASGNRKQLARKLDGARVAGEIGREIAAEVASLRRIFSVAPRLVVVRVGDDPASIVYVRNKIRTSAELGIESEQRELAAETTTAQLLDIIETLNARDDVDGMLVQTPLPPHIDAARILEAIDPAKDVDGFHPLNVGRLNQGRPTLISCTPAGIMELLKRENVPITGRHACVIGRSQIVGRPMAALLLQHDATVTICHSRTRELDEVTRRADILVAAIGRAGFVRREHVKEGATVIDVGMNRVTDVEAVRSMFSRDADARVETIRRRGYTLVGDVHPAEVEEVAGALTPVPGGIGPLTVAMLMSNTIVAARRRRGIGAQAGGREAITGTA